MAKRNRMSANALVWILGLGLASVAAQAQQSAPQPDRKGILFEDSFDRAELGPHYEIVTPDMNRFAISDGGLLLVAAKPVKNFVLLKKSLPGDFVATTQATMEIAKGNFVALYYHIDENNYLYTGVTAATGCQSVPWSRTDCSWSKRRQPFFTKVVGGETNNIVLKIPTLGTRSLAGYSEKEEPWYFQIRRDGIKYTAQISVDGVRWTDLGTHVVVPKHGRLGMATGSGGGVENAAEFGELVVQE